MVEQSNIRTRIATFLRLASARAWLSFCLLSFLFAITFCIMDGDDPLQSDDPYLVGLIFGSFAACLSAAYSLAELIGSKGPLKTIVWLTTWGLWCGLIWLVLSDAPEGGGIVPYIIIGSAVAALVEWPLLRFRVPHSVFIALSIVGASFIGLYLHVTIMHWMRWH